MIKSPAKNPSFYFGKSIRRFRRPLPHIGAAAIKATMFAVDSGGEGSCTIRRGRKIMRSAPVNLSLARHSVDLSPRVCGPEM